MAQLKTFVCDICNKTETESVAGDGVWNWAQMIGVKLNDVDNPLFCPICIIPVMNLIDKIADSHKGDKK